MSKIRTYKSVCVKSVNPSKFVFFGKKVKLSVGVDVGKDKHYVTLYVRDLENDIGVAERPWTVTPRQIPILVEKLSEIAKTNQFSIGMESSGTYGDPLRQALTLAGFEVLQVRTKLVHDMKESDGSPSKFDGKDSTIIAKLVAADKGEAWGLPFEDDQKTKLVYILKKLRYQKNIFQQYVGRMEAELARFWSTWPNDIVPFYTTLALKYLCKRGGSPEGTLEAIQREIEEEFSGLHSDEKLQAVIESAQTPCGVKLNPSAREFIRTQAEEMLAIKSKISKLEKELEELSHQTDLIPPQLTEVLGKTAACLIMTIQGDPRNYFCANAFLKAMGLNLVENSSGKYQGQVHLSKRGNPEIRRLLFMSTLRLVQLPEIKPWYEAKKQGRRGKNGKVCCTPALIAVMRKVMTGLYQAIQKNEPFDPSVLFQMKKKHPSQGLTSVWKQTSREVKRQKKPQVKKESASRTKLNWPAVTQKATTKKSTKHVLKKEYEVLLE